MRVITTMAERTEWRKLRDRRMADPGAEDAYRAAQLAYEIGRTVRQVRQGLGWSQTELARATGMTQSAVARFEAGGTMPTLPVIERLARALDADLIIPLDVPRTNKRMAMSSTQYRSQLESKRKQRASAEKKVSEFRKKEADSRSAASRARAASEKTKVQSTANSKRREAERRESEANKAGQEAARWQAKLAGYAKDEADLQRKLTRAEQSENAAADRRRKREQQVADRRAATQSARVDARLDATEAQVAALRELRKPRPERLRILMLAASAEGDLRVGREQKRIRNAVESALHRDLVELDVRPSATTSDLLDGITKFRPHVVHFSGHSSDALIEFEDDLDEHHEGVVVSAEAFANAVAATDEPPLLVLLNSCNSASQIDQLVERVTPFAIGMSD